MPVISRRLLKNQTGIPQKQRDNPYKGLTLKQYFQLQKQLPNQPETPESNGVLECLLPEPTVSVKAKHIPNRKLLRRFKTDFEGASVSKQQNSLVISSIKSEQTLPQLDNKEKKKQKILPFVSPQPNAEPKSNQPETSLLKPPKMSNRFMCNQYQMSIKTRINSLHYPSISTLKNNWIKNVGCFHQQPKNPAKRRIYDYCLVKK